MKEKGLTVVSLFDGVSGGQQTLKELGISIGDYYASEIEKFPIKVTQDNFPDTIQLGNVKDVYYKDGVLYTKNEEYTIGEVDLVLGGSPCKDLSSSGKQEGMITEEKIELLSLEQYIDLKDRGFKFKGQSYLFWEYIRLLREIKPKYFLLENVRMKDKWKDIFTKETGVDLIEIDSSLVSAQVRKRLYWTNIPNVTQPIDTNIGLDDILEDITFTSPGAIRGRYLNKASIIGRRLNERGVRDDYNKSVPITQCLEVRASNTNKSNCLTTVEKDNVLTNMPIGRHPGAYTNNLPYRNYTVKEYARLQGFPDDYCKSVSDSQAKKAYGNGWNVPTIKHIFKGLVEEKA